VYTHRTQEPITPGTIVGVEIPIWPLGMVFGEGEGIAVSIAGHDLKLPEIENWESRKLNDWNQGLHTVHTGGENPSFLMLPDLKGQSPESRLTPGNVGLERPSTPDTSQKADSAQLRQDTLEPELGCKRRRT
jgi:hypothetical protein